MNEKLEKEKYIIFEKKVSREILDLSSFYYPMKFLIQKDFEFQISETIIYENISGKDIVRPYSIKDYADAFTESLLAYFLPTMKEITGLPQLEPTYSFVRFYEKGQWLIKHSDRASCQYSVTLPLATHDNTPWTFFANGNAIDLELGDMLVYKGCEVDHWREPYEGTWQVQAHLHYVNGAEEAYKPFILDGRNSLGSSPVGSPPKYSRRL